MPYSPYGVRAYFLASSGPLLLVNAREQHPCDLVCGLHCDMHIRSEVLITGALAPAEHEETWQPLSSGGLRWP